MKGIPVKADGQVGPGVVPGFQGRLEGGKDEGHEDKKEGHQQEGEGKEKDRCASYEMEGLLLVPGRPGRRQ